MHLFSKVSNISTFYQVNENPEVRLVMSVFSVFCKRSLYVTWYLSEHTIPKIEKKNDCEVISNLHNEANLDVEGPGMFFVPLKTEDALGTMGEK